MAHNYSSTPDPLRLPSIRSLEIGVYPANSNNTNNNANNTATTPVEYAQQQQYQSQLRYSEEYYQHSNSREMGYYSHDPSNASTTTTTNAIASTTGPTNSQAHTHTHSSNSASGSSSGTNASPYRRPRTISSNLNNHGSIDNANKYRDGHAHHSSSSAPSAGSGQASPTSVSGVNSGSLTNASGGVAGGSNNQNQRSSSYPYSGHMTYSEYYAQRGGGGGGGSATTTTPTSATAASSTSAASWYYAQNQNSSQSQQQQQQSTSSPVESTQALQQKPASVHSQQSQHYSHAASPLQSPVSSVPSQQQQYYQQPHTHTQHQNSSSYSHSTMHSYASSVSSQSQQQQGATRTPRFQPMHPSSSSLHPSGGMYPSTTSSTASHHGHHMTVPSINGSSSLAGGNGSNTSAAIPTSPVPANGLTQNLEEDANRAAAQGAHLSKIIEHCKILQTFADRYAQQNPNSISPAAPTPPTTSVSNPGGGPTPPEFSEMAQRANIVLKLVDELRKEAGVTVNLPSFSSPTSSGGIGGSMAMDEDTVYRKKRSWDDDGNGANLGNDDVDTLAHQDMALIRSKRAQGVGSNTAPGGNAKSKYKKRSRACPPGKCHSCNIKETPEWRRGPDGARTLCNACGLHYAKLLRKRDKNLGAGGIDLPPISVEMLRASTRADSAKHHADIGGSIALSGIGGTSSGSGVSSGSGLTSGSGLGGPVSSASGSNGSGSNSASDMTEITLQPVGVPPSHSSTTSSSGVTLSPINNNGSLTGPGRSVSSSTSGGSGGLSVHPWPTNVYRYTGPDSTSSYSGGAGSSYHSHSQHSSAHSTSHPHSHSLPAPPHHALHLPHPLQRSSNGYDGYSTSLLRSSAPVGGDGRGSPGG